MNTKIDEFHEDLKEAKVDLEAIMDSLSCIDEHYTDKMTKLIQECDYMLNEYEDKCIYIKQLQDILDLNEIHYEEK